MRMAADAGSLVIDDAAQGVGARVGRPRSVPWAISVCSASAGGKGRTGGGGGALLGFTERGATLLRDVEARGGAGGASISRAAALSAQWLFGRPSLYWLPASLPFLRLGDTPYHDPGPLHDMPAFCAGALSAQWAGSIAEIPVRRRCAAEWRARLETGPFRVRRAGGSTRGTPTSGAGSRRVEPAHGGGDHTWRHARLSQLSCRNWKRSKGCWCRAMQRSRVPVGGLPGWSPCPATGTSSLRNLPGEMAFRATRSSVK